MEDILVQYAPWIAAATAAVVFAEKIARITPTETDNKVIAWVYKIFAVIGIKVEDNPGKPKT